jgi:glucosamine--fructose-6-phosphate aminotransferase (isomerizing)
VFLPFESIPSKVEKALQSNVLIERIAEEYKDARNMLYLGRGYNFPVALEGALKLKEISYIHAEGYPAAEMKHGPIALIDPAVPVIALCPSGPLFEKTASNLQEAAARGGRVMAFTDDLGAEKLRCVEERIVVLPRVSGFSAAIL